MVCQLASKPTQDNFKLDSFLVFACFLLKQLKQCENSYYYHYYYLTVDLTMTVSCFRCGRLKTGRQDEKTQDLKTELWAVCSEKCDFVLENVVFLFVF